MRAVIRTAGLGDAPAIAAIYAPYVSDTVISFELVPPSPAEMEARMAKLLANYPWMVAEQDNAIIGYAYASPHRERPAYGWSVDTAVYVAPNAHRQGIGRALYSILIGILKAQGFHHAYAGITIPNSGSVGFHEAMGFRPIGVYREVGFKLGQWRDVGWWGLELAPANADPAPPKPFLPPR